jgi:hypothetical protein
VPCENVFEFFDVKVIAEDISKLIDGKENLYETGNDYH